MCDRSNDPTQYDLPADPRDCEHARTQTSIVTLDDATGIESWCLDCDDLAAWIPRSFVVAALDDAMSQNVRYQPRTLEVLQDVRRLFTA